jgi:hypothetical protein
MEEEALFLITQGVNAPRAPVYGFSRITTHNAKEIHLNTETHRWTTFLYILGNLKDKGPEKVTEPIINPPVRLRVSCVKS